MNLPHLHTLEADQLRSPIWVYDVVGQRMVWANTAALHLWESETLDELCQRDFAEGQSRAVEQTLHGYLERFSEEKQIDVWWEISPKGIKKRVFIRLSGVWITTDDGSQRLAMLLEGQYSPELLNAGDIPSAAMAVLFDQQGVLISSNPPFQEHFGADLKELQAILPQETGLRHIQSMGSLGQDIELNTLQGMRWHHAEVTIQQVLNQHDNPHSPYYVLTLIDIQERKLREIETANEARSDLLTGLLNRRGLLQYMASHEGCDYTLFYIDLDGFKPINDSYGHNAGDELLRHLAHVLMHQDGKKVCARLGGDEFVVVFLEALSDADIQTRANNLLHDLSRKVSVANDCLVRVSASIGIASSPSDSSDIYQLIVQADAAMYEAKKQGRHRSVVYQMGMESYMLRRTQILQYMDSAIANNQFEVHYQPIINGRTGDTILMEALIRWHHPTLGALPPLEFIGVAEDSGKIARLESWVIRRVCQDLADIRQRFSDDVRITINISGAHLVQPDFVAELLLLLEAYQCKPQDFVLELTESVLVPVVEDNNTCLDELVAHGFQLAIDDFGTGYSSLAYISQLPAQFVKIDKAFVDRLHQDQNTLLFIRDLCHKFNMQCIAEGVEQVEQAGILNDSDILLQQGYYFARPQPLSELENDSEEFTIRCQAGL